MLVGRHVRSRVTLTTLTRIQQRRRSISTINTDGNEVSSTPLDRPRNQVAIIGGGLAGLASAVYLLRNLTEQAKRQTRVVVFEREPRVGGWCRAERFLNGNRVESDQTVLDRDPEDRLLVFETGPRSIRPVGLQGWVTIELAQFLGLEPHILTVSKLHPSAKNRYLLNPSSSSSEPTGLTLLPTSLWSVVKDVLSNRQSLLRRVLPAIALEPFRRRSTLHVNRDHGDESVDSFFSRRFGPVLASDMISAMIHGIYAGDSRRLSIRSVFPQLWQAERESGSVILNGLLGEWLRKRGSIEKSRWRDQQELDDEQMRQLKQVVEARPGGVELVERMKRASVWGVRGGLEEITIRLRQWLEQEGVEFRLGSQRGQVERLELTQSDDGSHWSIATRSGETFTASHLITTIPSLLPAALSPPRFPATTVSVINLSFRSRDPLFPPGFGYLIPRTVPAHHNPHHVLGVLFDSDVMPLVDDSHDEGLIKCSVLLGGSYWLDQPPVNPPTHEVLVTAARDSLKMHFPDVDWPEPVHAFTNTHKECIPQIPPGARTKVRAFLDRLGLPGKGKVGIVGGGFSQVGVNGAVKGARDVGIGFAQDLNELVAAGQTPEHGGERLNRTVKRALVRNGMEMWQL
ncbi:oxygen-dependent protoporphyrinogen oxidase [Sporobolomyces koalae]|uniref:oxygen-dependent protoporphyrinogen oxidase n=1 Tax=Sporobolomyces koalae TaxID=500713 RepID=UPI00317F4B4A